MCPGLKDLPISKDVDDIGILHCSKPMRHNDHGAILLRLLEDRLDHFLRLGIQVRGRLIQEQEARVSNQRPGDGDALALTAR